MAEKQRSADGPFLPTGLRTELIEELQAFLHEVDFVDLYRRYEWKSDTYSDGFPDIYRLESQLGTHARTSGLTLSDVKAVALWGRLRNIGRIQGPATVLPRGSLYNDVGASVPELAANLLAPVRALQATPLRGVGPTYLSKMLRFAVPREYGAIDTRCVRTFGQGDPKYQRHSWVDLSARNDGYGWSIPSTQPAWPDAYGQWVNILRYFAHALPANCPHPVGFLAARLRETGVWYCADVEMALFSFASQFS